MAEIRSDPGLLAGTGRNRLCWLAYPSCFSTAERLSSAHVCGRVITGFTAANCHPMDACCKTPLKRSKRPWQKHTKTNCIDRLVTRPGEQGIVEWHAQEAW